MNADSEVRRCMENSRSAKLRGAYAQCRMRSDQGLARWKSTGLRRVTLLLDGAAKRLPGLPEVCVCGACVGA